jgi:hypothetical protein
MGLTISLLQDSKYESEKLNGLFCHLKNDPSKKYMTIRWDDDKQNVHNTIYLDPQRQIIGDTLDSAKHLMTPSYITSVTKGYGRNKVLKVADINVCINTIKIENIAVLKIAGKTIVDPNLIQYLPFVI